VAADFDAEVQGELARAAHRLDQRAAKSYSTPPLVNYTIPGAP
jgi:hypothetical protein